MNDSYYIVQDGHLYVREDQSKVARLQKELDYVIGILLADELDADQLRYIKAAREVYGDL